MNQRWTVGDVVTYGCVIIAAFIEAGEAGLRQSPKLSAQMPGMLTSEWWGFVPLILLTIAGVVWLGRQLWALGYVLPVSTQGAEREELESRSDPPGVNLTLIKAFPAYTNDVKVTFKMKLRIELRNDSQDCIDVENVEWVTGSGGVTGQPWSCLQLQRTSDRQPGGGGWQLEESRVHVQQHGVFRASVALDPSLSEDDIRRRIAAKRTGTLSLRVLIAHQLTNRQIHL